MENEVTKTIEKDVRRVVSEILNRNGDGAVEIAEVLVPEEEDGCLVVIVHGMVKARSLAEIGDTFGDLDIAVDGAGEKYWTRIYIS